MYETFVLIRIPIQIVTSARARRKKNILTHFFSALLLHFYGFDDAINNDNKNK